MWDSDINQWVGQGSSFNVLAEVFLTNVAPAMITEYEPNFWGNIQENILESTKDDNFLQSSLKLVGNIGYKILDDAYVYGTRNFYKNSNNAKHLNQNGASPQEVVDSGLNTVTTFVPSPIKMGLITKFTVATFRSAFKGTFLTRLAPATRGTIIKLVNKVIIQLNTKNFISVNKSVAKKIEKSK